MTGEIQKPSKGGRPSSYKPEFVELAKHFAMLGATDKQMADAFDVSEVTLNAWKKQYPEFLKSLKDGKLSADASVARSLYHRALGYAHEDVDIRVLDGRIVQTPLIKHYPPDTTACIYWLKNRQPELWRDKTEVATDATTVADTLKAIASKLPD